MKTADPNKIPEKPIGTVYRVNPITLRIQPFLLWKKTPHNAYISTHDAVRGNVVVERADLFYDTPKAAFDATETTMQERVNDFKDRVYRASARLEDLRSLYKETWAWDV